jgi:small basic protein (TIGR04137 family)
MSQHSSLKIKLATGVKRNVLKRRERIAILSKLGKWKPGDRVLGLPKTKPM